ncbi:glycosyltransferase family 2 protein [Halorussus salilacus]|uniref:glycosyltransferase n=1 Tax=Halorussus salilacus TaxID=2953750 RepID=UPI0020A2173A|nr:glycosyltransferase family A protein [Halorussus salilacus]USZ67931.1 glycosyltransferase family 2 protein [Halorussus salilacus]
MSQETTRPRRDAATDLPTLSVVVIARNEERRIERCLESVLAAAEPFDAETIVVDSNSTDRTAELAADYPATVFRIPTDDLSNPSAGRYVGGAVAEGEQVLFVDGDIVVEDGDWLETASRMVAADPRLAGVDGHLDERPHEDSASDRPEEVGWIRGVALYDADALAAVGGFDPYLRAVEDLHLGHELTAAGYRFRRLQTVVGHQIRDDAGLHEPFRRWERGFFDGVADALARSADSPSLLAKHLWRLRYAVLTGVWLVVGVASLVALPAFAVWAAVSAVAVAALVRLKGPTLAYKVVMGWVSVALAAVLYDWSPPPDPEEYPLDRVERVASGPRLG